MPIKEKQVFYDTRGVKSINDKAAKAKQAHKRVVPGFSTQSRQTNVQVKTQIQAKSALIRSQPSIARFNNEKTGSKAPYYWNIQTPTDRIHALSEILRPWRFSHSP